MTLLLLLACTEPGTLGSVSDALGARAAASGELPIRTATAIAGLLAETCAAGSIESYTFVGRSAAALGASTADVTVADAMQTWTFVNVGVDGGQGTLALETDGQAESFAITYVAEGVSLTAGMELRACDPAVPSAAVGGTGTWTTPASVVGLTVLGAAPTNGLTFSPTTADVPGGGQVRAEDEAAGWTILLDDAGTLAAEAPAWTGGATGDGWTAEIAVPWP